MNDKLKAAAEMALEALEWSHGGEPMPTKELKAINAIRQALYQSPDATKMIDNVCIRYWVQDTMESGHWATTDIMERTTAEILLSGTYGNGFQEGEIVPLPEMPVDRGAWDDVEDATKWVDELRGDEPNLLNQTCCECGRSGGFALYCGWCWSKGDKPVADVNTSEERVPISDKQGHECQELKSSGPIGEIIEAHGLIAVSIPEMPPVGTKLYAAPYKLWVTLSDDDIKEIVGNWGDTPIMGYTRRLFDKIDAMYRKRNQDSNDTSYPF